ncbi:MAG: cadherin-like beta sandwich domain-containing protein [Kofleriaceae bacterium]|nr:cadherin-like beta sandwich domain-containing protein [Kofleriaceae bacterium]
MRLLLFLLFTLVAACGSGSDVTSDAGSPDGDSPDGSCDAGCQSSDATLAALAVVPANVGELTPSFAPEVTSYSWKVPFWITEVSLVPTAAATSAKITVDGAPIVSGTSTPALALDVGANPFAIDVTAANGDVRTYTVVVVRAPEHYVKASNTGAGDRFGGAIAISGDTMVVGASGESSAATGVGGDETNNSAAASGAVYVFVRSETGWSQQAYLKASNTDAGDYFGSAVALDGDTLVVGALGEDSASATIDGNQADNSLGDAGAVYVFERTGTTWAQTAYLKSPNPSRYGYFGASLGLENDRLAVGAYYEWVGSARTGAVYVLERSGGTWSVKDQLTAAQGDSNDWFGQTIALSGDTIAVGAYGEDSSANAINGDQSDESLTASGAAYVFRLVGTDWMQEAFIKPRNPRANGFFGRALSLSGDTLAVGSYVDASGATGIGGDVTDTSADRSGAVFVYRRSGTTWSEEAYIKSSNSNAGDYFGMQLVIDGDRLAVSAPDESSSASGVGGDRTDNSLDGSGAVYLFERAGGTWSERAYIKAATPGESDRMGDSGIALEGTALAIGVISDDSTATGIGGDATDNSAVDSGAVYVLY